MLTTLIDNKVPESELENLKEAIKNDGYLMDGKLGAHVLAWIGNMVGKAINKVWDMSVERAVPFLHSAISAFYGIA